MFEWFRKRKIERYTRAASDYMTATYKAPAPITAWYSVDDTAADLESPQKSSVKFSERGDVRYSLQETDADIPAKGDKFRKDAVEQLFALYSLNNASLNKQLDSALNLTFVDMLTRYINMKSWRDSKVYKAAQLDRRLFSKIMSDREYKPAKDTALALAIALELTLQQTNDLLDRAGYTLSHSNKRDVIIEYFIREGVHNLVDINEVLYKLDQKIIGR